MGQCQTAHYEAAGLWLSVLFHLPAFPLQPPALAMRFATFIIVIIDIWSIFSPSRVLFVGCFLWLPIFMDLRMFSNFFKKSCLTFYWNGPESVVSWEETGCAILLNPWFVNMSFPPSISAFLNVFWWILYITIIVFLHLFKVSFFGEWI